MKKATVFALVAALVLGLGSIALAGPVVMTDTQMDQVVAGQIKELLMNPDGQFQAVALSAWEDPLADWTGFTDYGTIDTKDTGYKNFGTYISGLNNGTILPPTL